jgi:nucleotide-binding universal stress UspA family protein
MYKRILIATDGSDLAAKAVSVGLQLAKALGAEVVALSATEPWSSMVGPEGSAFNFPIEDYERAAAESASRILDDVRQQATSMGVASETVHAKDFPAEAIVDGANSMHCDLIVMASHGRRGLARALLGSQALRVLTLSSVPVLICRQP